MIYTTIKDIAKKLNISIATVSRAFNDKSDIKLETKNLNFLRSQWRNSNHMTLYYNYFAVFSFETFHTFSYIADYLEVIHENAIYENKYFEFYGIKNE